MKYAFISQNECDVPVVRQCQWLSVSTSDYNWLHRQRQDCRVRHERCVVIDHTARTSELRSLAAGFGLLTSIGLAGAIYVVVNSLGPGERANSMRPSFGLDSIPVGSMTELRGLPTRQVVLVARHAKDAFSIFATHWSNEQYVVPKVGWRTCSEIAFDGKQFDCFYPAGRLAMSWDLKGLHNPPWAPVLELIDYEIISERVYLN